MFQERSEVLNYLYDCRSQFLPHPAWKFYTQIRSFVPGLSILY
jgi:hypothetical protein